MKIKNFITCVSTVLLVAIKANGQGQVNFANGSMSLVQIEIGSSSNPALVAAPSSVYGTRIQLYYSLSATPVASGLANVFDTTGWTAVGNLGTAIASNGRFSVGSVTIANVAGGTSVWLEAIAWTGTSQTAATAVSTLSAALQGGSLIASSGAWQQVLGDPNSTPPGTPTPTAANMNALGNIVLCPCPEPGTVSLICLGAASVFMFRRRKG
jgi:hypothetical protein